METLDLIDKKIPQSPYEKELEERRKVNGALWDYNKNRKLKCDMCQQTLVIPKGETYLLCQMCGKRTYMETIKQDKKTLTDPNTKTGPIIISQIKKRRVNILKENQGLTEEDLEDLAGAGIYPATWKDYFP